MKRIVMLTVVLVMMLVSFGGCFWGGYEGRDRDGGYGRGGGYDDRGEGRDKDGGRDQGERHDKGGEKGGDHEERH